jgi:mono/diheme cytochrome c family protein
MNAKSSTRGLTLLATLIGGVLLGVACEQPDEPQVSSAPTPTVNANNQPPVATNTAAANLPLAGAGLDRAEGLYKANCASCHLASGRGEHHHRKDGIPDFTDAAWHEGKTDAALNATIANGDGRVMPAFGSKLAEDEIALLVRYIHRFPSAGNESLAGGTSRAPKKGKSRAKATPPPADAGHSGHH